MQRAAADLVREDLEQVYMQHMAGHNGAAA
jgi:hypothetical protein